MKDKLTYEELENQIDELKKQNEILRLPVNSDKNSKDKQAMKASNEKYRFDSAADKIFIHNEEKIPVVNPLNSKRLGYSLTR